MFSISKVITSRNIFFMLEIYLISVTELVLSTRYSAEHNRKYADYPLTTFADIIYVAQRLRVLSRGHTTFEGQTRDVKEGFFLSAFSISIILCVVASYGFFSLYVEDTSQSSINVKSRVRVLHDLTWRVQIRRERNERTDRS